MCSFKCAQVWLFCTHVCIITYVIVNPWHMCEGYGSHSVCVCVCVCVHYCTSGYITRLEVSSVVLKGFLWHFKRIYCVDFAENALFSSFGVICLQPVNCCLHHALWRVLDRMNNRDSDGFFSITLVCRCSDSSYNSTDLSLIIANYQQHFLPCVSRSADLAWHTWCCCIIV